MEKYDLLRCKNKIKGAAAVKKTKNNLWGKVGWVRESGQTRALFSRNS